MATLYIKYAKKCEKNFFHKLWGGGLWFFLARGWLRSCDRLSFWKTNLQKKVPNCVKPIFFKVGLFDAEYLHYYRDTKHICHGEHIREKNTLKIRSGETYFDIYIPREELSGKMTTIKDVAID